MAEEPTRRPGNRLKARKVADDGRDELNLAEFPVAALSMRVPKSQKTLVYQDRVWDRGRRQHVNRKLTVSASDKYGLPTALDDEVLVGLVQLTTRADPPGRTVHFTRYQLLNALGWRKEGKSYRRLEQSLKRWVGVTLYYDKAWWDKAERSWASESFHVLEKVTLYDRDQHRRHVRKSVESASLSSFVWSEVIFRSFHSGYLKRLDLEVYRSLKLAIAKRMYRFLDKRFYHRDSWTFDLREFACEHIGISRNNDVGQLKRRLQPALAELELAGVLKARDEDQRYLRIARGKWNIVVERAMKNQLVNCHGEDSGEPCQSLVDRGVTLSMARTLTRQYPAGKIREKVELLDAMLRADRTAVSSPGGFLVEAIRNDYAPFARRNRELLREGPPQEKPVRKAQAGRADRERHDADRDSWAQEDARVQGYLESLPSQARKQLTDEAVAQAPHFLRSVYSDRLREGSPQAEWYREQIVRHHVRQFLIQDP